MDIPDKLDPIPGFTLNFLPAWVADFGTVEGGDEFPGGMIVMTGKGPDGTLYHVDVNSQGVVFDETLWERFVHPMVECIGMQLFEAEYPGLDIETRRWEWAAAAGERDLTQHERDVIERRKQLTTWKPPFSVLPD